jgi:hypothetical protein
VAQTHSVIAKQHVDFFRKTLSRKRLLRWEAPGAAYVPFIGDGDIAVELYGDRRIYGADIDADRTAVAASRLPTADIRVADCDQWVFRGLKDPIAVADFDAYGNPYKGFNDFWKLAPKADRLLVFFTDGQGLNIEWKGRWHHPSGEECFAPGYKAGVSGGDVLTRRRVWSFWYAKHVWPWFLEQLGDEWRVLDRARYIRGIMLYWGAVIERRNLP